MNWIFFLSVEICTSLRVSLTGFSCLYSSLNALAKILNSVIMSKSIKQMYFSLMTSQPSNANVRSFAMCLTSCVPLRTSTLSYCTSSRYWLSFSEFFKKIEALLHTTYCKMHLKITLFSYCSAKLDIVYFLSTKRCTYFSLCTERDAFDTLFDHAPDKLNVVKRVSSRPRKTQHYFAKALIRLFQSLITFVNRHLEKINFEVTDLDSQVRVLVTSRVWRPIRIIEHRLSF